MTSKQYKDDCIFCRIARGLEPCVKIWEDRDHLAILDGAPNVKGMTLVIPRAHYDSDATDMPDKEYAALMLAAKRVAKTLETGLDVQRAAIVMEGLGVNHVHIKLYPIYGLDKKFQEMWSKDRIFFKRYSGYISTQLGPNISIEEREAIAREILRRKHD